MQLEASVRSEDMINMHMKSQQQSFEQESRVDLLLMSVNMASLNYRLNNLGSWLRY